MKNKEIFNLLNEKALETLKKNCFTGKLTMKWKNGKIVDFNLTNSVKMSVQKDFFPHSFFDFDGEEDSDDDFDE